MNFLEKIKLIFKNIELKLLLIELTIYYMNKTRKNILILIIYFLFLYSLYFFIVNPIFWWLKNINLNWVSYWVDKNNLEKYVKTLSQMERTSQTGILLTSNYLVWEIEKMWLKNYTIQKYDVYWDKHKNIIIHFKWKKSGWKYILWAHYDACDGYPWADDNASWVAWVLEIARILKGTALLDRDIDLVLYSTEEPPNFWTHDMWSFHHAKSIQKDMDLKLVMVYDMIWYFDEKQKSQNFPAKILEYLYPNNWNFIAIISNYDNFFTNRKVKKWFFGHISKNNLIWVESMNAPEFIAGVDFSDHRNYWKFNIPSVMITDTSFYRNQNYHTKWDTYEKLNYKKMKEVVDATLYTLMNIK